MATEHNYQASHNDDIMEKDFEDVNHLHAGMDTGTALKRIRTAGSISISPELFEKIYLSPQNAVKGDLRKTFGNPTPLALVGFLLSLTPLSCDLMGWRGAGGSGAAGVGSYFFFGGLLMVLGGLGEFIIGNTFPFVVFTSFGAYWLTFASTLTPMYNAFGAYSTSPNTNAGIASGLNTKGFNASFAFFLLWMGVLCLVYLICALRTNVVFVLIFFFLVIAFGCLAGAYWNLAQAFANPLSATEAKYIVESHVLAATRCVVAGGAFCFIVCLLGWWIFAAIMLAALDFPFQIPVGDLSTLITGASEKASRQHEAEADPTPTHN